MTGRGGVPRDLVWLLGAALAVNATVLVQLGGHPLLQPHGELDTTYYVELARRVAAGGPLAVRDAFFVSPLYVYFLAAVFAVHQSLAAVRVVQIGLGTAAVGFVYLTARLWFDPRVARVAAALALVTGLFAFNEILVLQSALDPFLAACALYLVSRTQADDARWPLVAAGALLGLFALNRPNALVYGAAVPALVAFASWPRGGRVALGRGALVLLPLAVVIGANAARNYAASGEAVLISSHGGLNFYIGNSETADGVYDRVEGVTPSIRGQVRDATRLAEAAEGRPLSASEVSAYFFGRAWAWMTAHPGAAARLFVRKLALVLNRTDVPLNYSYAFYRLDEPTLLRALVVGPWLLMPLGLVGLILGARRTDFHRSPVKYWVWASFVPVYGLSVAAFFVSDRYRMPMLVPLSVSAAALVVWAFDRLRARRFAAVVAPAAAVLLVSVIAGWPSGLDDGLGGERTRKALWLVEEGRYDDALRYVAEIAPHHSHPGVLHFRVGEALTAAGRYDAAIAELMGARRIDGARPAIELTLGQALLMDGRSGEAVSHLAAALDGGFRPEASGPWLVRALAAAGGTKEAARALAALPDAVVEAAQVDTQVELGTLALRLEAPGAAERWLRAAVAHAPDRAEAYEQLAVALVMLGRPAEALGPIETACRLAPSSASAHLNLAVVYAQLGRFAEAREQAETAARLDPTEPRAAALLKALPPGRR